MKRPAIFDVTGEKLLQLNPVARLLDEGKKLSLTDEERVRLDSLNAALVTDIAPFASRVDSLRPRGGQMNRQREGGRRAPGGGRNDGEGPGGQGLERFEQLELTVGMVKLRYDAAVLSAERILGDERRETLGKIVEKGQRKMEEYAAPLGSPR